MVADHEMQNMHFGGWPLEDLTWFEPAIDAMPSHRQESMWVYAPLYVTTAQKIVSEYHDGSTELFEYIHRRRLIYLIDRVGQNRNAA
jgi:hypothetical protein